MRHFLALGLLLFTPFLLAEECKLKKPIAMPTVNLLEERITLHEAVFDQVPKFTQPGKYDSKTDTLIVKMGYMEINNEKSPHVGAAVQIENKLESVGFGGGYIGTFDFKGKNSVSGGSKTYQVTLTNKYTEPGHAKEPALTELTIKIEKGMLTSWELKIPVFKNVESSGTTEKVAFTGEHQTLCLQQASLEP